MKCPLLKVESRSLLERSLTISTGASKSMSARGMHLNMCAFASSVYNGDGLVTKSCPQTLVTLWTVAY